MNSFCLRAKKTKIFARLRIEEQNATCEGTIIRFANGKSCRGDKYDHRQKTNGGLVCREVFAAVGCAGSRRQLLDHLTK